MKIYTHYSDSHKDVYESYFKKSLRSLYTKDELPLRVLYHKQTTRDGHFMTEGWLDAMDYKVDVILNALFECKDSWFIFADVDVVFIKPFLQDLEQRLEYYDAVFQEDRTTLCAGFFACKSNERTMKLFQTVKTTFKNNHNDQVALNRYKDLARCGLLDNKRYYTIGNYFNGTHNAVWDNETNIIPPKELLVYHANYIEGVNNKIKAIQMIAENYKTL